ncbi:DUF5799 family protein [Halobellus ruber]|uniref:Uncharacterized protein n=1 Tax=Halobellus ruber TaxID=2761102 RepID=A0A7J9SIX1_9EURY|nr:DUF5799 family protein [Halobellus ruber]MBB6646079.1 hypothetical protein [Halobellus ruber]
MTDWTDSIVGDRMTVDREFNDRVENSEFTSQEWGLIMTAIELDIQHADDPERARIVADTEKLPQIMPELENVRSQMSQMGAGAGGDTGSSAGGIVDSLKGALGLGGGGGGVDEDRVDAAERLTQAYADALQSHLESKNKWEQVRIAYQE